MYAHQNTYVAAQNQTVEMVIFLENNNNKSLVVDDLSLEDGSGNLTILTPSGKKVFYWPNANDLPGAIELDPFEEYPKTILVGGGRWNDENNSFGQGGFYFSETGNYSFQLHYVSGRSPQRETREDEFWSAISIIQVIGLPQGMELPY